MREYGGWIGAEATGTEWTEGTGTEGTEGTERTASQTEEQRNGGERISEVRPTAGAASRHGNDESGGNTNHPELPRFAFPRLSSSPWPASRAGRTLLRSSSVSQFLR